MVKICDCTGQFKGCNLSADSVSNPTTGTIEPPGTYCFDSSLGDPQPKIVSDWIMCGRTQCDYGEPAAQMLDPRFHGRPCTPWTSYTGRRDSYCYDPARDPQPAETYQRCGDYWMAAVHLTTDWHWYFRAVQGHAPGELAMPSKFLDLTAVTVLRLTWQRGWIDYWVAEVNLYRSKRQ